MTENEFLRQLGLSEKQTKIYLDVAAFPDASVVEIFGRTDIPRSSIYLELNRLAKIGYITSQLIGTTQRYRIVPPESISMKLREEEERIKELTSGIDGFIERLGKLKETHTEAYSIQVYKGQKGVKQLLWNILGCKSGEVIGYSPGNLEDVVDRKFAEKWRAEFKKRRLMNRIILNSSVPLDWSDVPNFLEKNVKARTLEDKKIRFDREILIYDTTMVVVGKKIEADQYGVELTDKLLVSSQVQLFNFIWENVAKEVD